ncbi:MAG: ribosomal protein S18 acetylase RimI-like enzyme [Vicingaceae bacterium]|jgi:ribosomal protein S18 acetylase RimI-like enzyme
MNQQIIENLYEFWSYIGIKTGRLTETKGYKSVSMANSDWPNRIFSISNKQALLAEAIALSQAELLPNGITTTKSNYLENNSDVQLLFRQRNMALDLQKIDDNFNRCENIFQVKSKEDALLFAKIASEAFGYRVEGNTANLVNQDPLKIKIFNYIENDECLGCGIVYFDSFNTAGLHMIGTLPKGRGRGIGKKMTEKLLSEAIENGSKYCVLHASLMGESIYKKLGFIGYGELETYSILKPKATSS